MRIMMKKTIAISLVLLALAVSLVSACPITYKQEGTALEAFAVQVPDRASGNIFGGGSGPNHCQPINTYPTKTISCYNYDRDRNVIAFLESGNAPVINPRFETCVERHGDKDFNKNKDFMATFSYFNKNNWECTDQIDTKATFRGYNQGRTIPTLRWE
jgi:hypothetical protein